MGVVRRRGRRNDDNAGPTTGRDPGATRQLSGNVTCYLMAWGFSGEPTAPGMTSGGATSWNS